VTIKTITPVAATQDTASPLAIPRAAAPPRNTIFNTENTRFSSGTRVARLIAGRR
jgi:hypothetical protein